MPIAEDGSWVPASFYSQRPAGAPRTLVNGKSLDEVLAETARDRVSRELKAAARRFADGNSARLQDLPASRQLFATVTVATAGAGPGGNYLIKVDWRGQELTAAGYSAAYTPAVGHRVKCSLVDDQLVVEGRYVN